MSKLQITLREKDVSLAYSNGPLNHQQIMGYPDCASYILCTLWTTHIFPATGPYQAQWWQEADFRSLPSGILDGRTVETGLHH